jgi:aryl-alcohol dehydrogenase-like predicted oxidoreductase
MTTTLDSYVTLGRSGLRVSPLALGAMTFGQDNGWGADVQTSEAILTEYLDRGGNLVDTANIYTNGHSEAILGDYLAAHPGLRDRIVLSTKFFATLRPGDPNAGGAGRKAILDQLDNSLRRLRTDYVDLYWLHNWDRRAPIEETLRTLDDLVRAGKVRYVGVSDLPAWVVARAQTVDQFRGWAPITALQLEYSLLERTVEGELLPMAQELGIGVLPWSPLRGGHLTGKFTREQGSSDSLRTQATGLPQDGDWPTIDAVVKIAADLGVSPAQVALAWVRGRAGVTATLIGARTLDQLHANLGSLEVDLTPDQLAVLDEISTPTLDFPAYLAPYSPRLGFGGATVDGVTNEVWPALAHSDTRY